MKFRTETCRQLKEVTLIYLENVTFKKVCETLKRVWSHNLLNWIVFFLEVSRHFSVLNSFKTVFISLLMLPLFSQSFIFVTFFYSFDASCWVSWHETDFNRSFKVSHVEEEQSWKALGDVKTAGIKVKLTSKSVKSLSAWSNFLGQNPNVSLKWFWNPEPNM